MTAPCAQVAARPALAALDDPEDPGELPPRARHVKAARRRATIQPVVDLKLVPSRNLTNGRAALERMLSGAKWLHGAVAFVTESGVDLLGELVDDAGVPPEGVRLVARGAPITEPQALLAFADRLEAEVRVVSGPDALAFHPKLWISRTDRETWVLSGSGNLTAGGLATNAEQFELMRFPHTRATVTAPARTDPLVDEHTQRMHRFRELGRPLRELIGSPTWTTWLAQLDARAELVS